jgi:hypothetical protein
MVEEVLELSSGTQYPDKALEDVRVSKAIVFNCLMVAFDRPLLQLTPEDYLI